MTDPEATSHHPSPKRQIATGSFWLGTSFIVTTLTGPLLIVAMVRIMTHIQYGALALATSVVSLLAILTGLGLEPAIAQLASAEYSKHGETGMKGVLHAALRIAVTAMLLTLVCYGGIALIAYHISTLRATVPALLAMTPIVVVAPLVGVSTGFLRATYRPQFIAIVTSSSALAVAVPTLLVLTVFRPSAALIGGIRSVGVIITAGVLGWALRTWVRKNHGQPQMNMHHRTLLRFGGAMILTGVFTVAIARLDVLVLGIYQGSRVVSFYAPASGIANTILGLPAVIAGFFLPVVSRAAAKQDNREVRHLYHWASRWNLALCSPALAVIIVCPASVMQICFGSDYGFVGGPLRVLGLGAIAQVLFGFNGLTLDAYGLPGIVATRQLISICISALACLLLIPPLGIYGAAWATTGGLVLANMLCARSLFTRFRITPWNTASVPTVVVFVVSAACSVPLANASLNILRPFLVGVIVGACTLLTAFRVAEPTERQAIIRQLRRLTPWKIQINSALV